MIANNSPSLQKRFYGCFFFGPFFSTKNCPHSYNMIQKSSWFHGQVDFQQGFFRCKKLNSWCSNLTMSLAWGRWMQGPTGREFLEGFGIDRNMLNIILFKFDSHRVWYSTWFGANQWDIPFDIPKFASNWFSNWIPPFLMIFGPTNFLRHTLSYIEDMWYLIFVVHTNTDQYYSQVIVSWYSLVFSCLLGWRSSHSDP